MLHWAISLPLDAKQYTVVSKQPGQKSFLKIGNWNFFLFELQNHEGIPKWNMPIDTIICDQM